MEVKCIRCHGEDILKYWLSKADVRFKCRECEKKFTYDDYYKFIGSSPLDKFTGQSKTT